MTNPINNLGITVLQQSQADELDVVLVHGLQGHPANTWTYKIQSPGPGSKSKRTEFVNKLGFGKSKESSGEPSISRSDLRDQGKTSTNVFWPRDLLTHHESCNRVRIMTYGYDSDIYKIADTANFSTISSHGESLLSSVAAIRADHMHRPLMFITHSLGGLVVKSALNTSRVRSVKTDADLRAVVDSTFSIIFFGTPHRGSDAADYGRRVARAVSALTMRRYNDKIVRNLARNTELLTNLRKDIEATLEHMIDTNRFESSTFQENRGLTGVKGFSGQVVADDSTELGRNDRNDHIERNHMEMCKFSGLDDSEYAKVHAEIKRHIQRISERLTEKEQTLLASLHNLGKFALERVVKPDGIDPRTKGTLEWLYTAPAFRSQSGRNESCSLAEWQVSGPDLFWVTGRPGSGKSTTMKLIYDNIREYGIGRRTSKDRNTGSSDWCDIGLFITNRGQPKQRSWEAMLYGLLFQLLRRNPALTRDVVSLAQDKKSKILENSWTAKSSKSEAIETETYDWDLPLLEEALRFCMTQKKRPIKAFVVLDGLDELEDNYEIVTRAVDFLKELAKKSESTKNAIRVCISSRPEQLFLDLFRGTWQIDIHDHTRQDIRIYVWKRLRQNPCFRGRKEKDIAYELDHILTDVTERAQGVFLWARSVTTLLGESLKDREPLEKQLQLLNALPSDMNELFRYILCKIEPRICRKAFIMLEVILRSRRPLTLLELSLVVKVTEQELDGSENPWSHLPAMNYPSISDFGDPQKLKAGVIASCKCLVEVARYRNYYSDADHDSDDSHQSYEDWYWRYLGQRRDHQVLELESEDDVEDHPLRSSAIRPSSGGSSSSNISRISNRDEETESGDLKDKYRTDSELMVCSQYTDYNNDPTDDLSRSLVCLLHRSAKDFLLDPDSNYLDTLFKSAESGERPLGNGHVYILYFARAWVKVPDDVRKQLRCHFSDIDEIVFHASQLESTVDPEHLAHCFTLLDDINDLITEKTPQRECWPLYWKGSRRGMATWHVTFPALAVVLDMRGYMTYRIKRAKGENDLEHFLNGKRGRPLLHFSVYFSGQSPKPRMTQLLLEAGARIDLTFHGKAAVESLLLNDRHQTGGVNFEIIKLLIEKGSPADSRYYPDGNATSMWKWFPLLHVVAHGFGVGLEHRVAFMKLLHKHGADLNGTDWQGRTFLDKLYWGGAHLSGEDWHWLFRHGAKVSKAMISGSLDEPFAESSASKASERIVEGAEKMSAASPARAGIPSGLSAHAAESNKSLRSNASNPQAAISDEEELISHHQCSSEDKPEGTPSPQTFDENMEVPLSQQLAHRRVRSLSWSIDATKISPSRFRIRGLCDGTSPHEAYKYLSQRCFRKREWYTDEAVAEAEALQPMWFA